MRQSVVVSQYKARRRRRSGVGHDPRRFVHIALRNGEPFMVVTGDVVVKDSDGLSFVTAPRGANPRTLEQEIARVARLQAQVAPAQLEEL